MKNKQILVLSMIILFFQSCNFHTPENYFGRTALNTNRYHNLGARDFSEMKASKKANMLYAEFADGEFKIAESYEAHVRGMKMYFVNEDIDKVKELKVTEDTESLIKTSLEVYNLAKSIYENDYIKIAKLMDTNASPDAIAVAMQKLENSVNQFHKKRDALMEIAIPYAEENGIDVTF